MSTILVVEVFLVGDTREGLGVEFPPGLVEDSGVGLRRGGG
jgi:hypothetical protein